ncbi:MAG TPA: hypothetical protein VFB58_11120 [Chloroflexota bacterium]|nr:hypothetical protein [Chloroflexota bacterium]
MSTSVPLLIVAAGIVGFLHSILPDHWVPLAVIGRTQRWSMGRVARMSFLASVGHVLTSLIIAAIIAAVGLQFRQAFETQQGHIVGIILVLTGLGFLVWALTGHGGHHHHDGHHHDDHHQHSHGYLHDDTHGHDDHGTDHLGGGGSLIRRFAAVAVPFGAAASPDLTILPVALAASAIGVGAVIACLASFTAVTLGTFIVLTVGATAVGYQVQGEWLEDNGNYLTAIVLISIGIAVYLGL